MHTYLRTHTYPRTYNFKKICINNMLLVSSIVYIIFRNVWPSGNVWNHYCNYIYLKESYEEMIERRKYVLMELLKIIYTCISAMIIQILTKFTLQWIRTIVLFHLFKFWVLCQVMQICTTDASFRNEEMSISSIFRAGNID